MKQYFYPIFILLGLLLGQSFPFYALALSKWAFIVLFVLLSINLITIDLKFKSILNYNSTDFYFLFFSYLFIPALVYILATIFQLPYSLKLGFFMTALAPMAIITPQFLSQQNEKQLALKQILGSTFLFPLYFSLMSFLFFNKLVKFNILSIILDSLILTIFPFILIYFTKKYLSKRFDWLLSPIGRSVPLLNMLLIGVLCFIFVGSSYLKNDLHQLRTWHWVAITAFALFQDFGVFWLSKKFNFSRPYSIAVSMKNVPFVGLFSLLFFPQALVTIISILVAHVLLISFHSFNLKKESLSIN